MEIENYLENAIKNEIKNLKQYKYLSSKDLGIKPRTIVSIDESDIEDENIKLSINDIKEIFLNLRRRRLSFYEAILEEYKSRKNTTKI